VELSSLEYKGCFSDAIDEIPGGRATESPETRRVEAGCAKSVLRLGRGVDARAA